MTLDARARAGVEFPMVQYIYIIQLDAHPIFFFHKNASAKSQLCTPPSKTMQLFYHTRLNIQCM